MSTTETDYGTVTHPMEGLCVDAYIVLKAERDALAARVKELEGLYALSNQSFFGAMERVRELENDPMRLLERLRENGGK